MESILVELTADQIEVLKSLVYMAAFHENDALQRSMFDDIATELEAATEETE